MCGDSPPFASQGARRELAGGFSPFNKSDAARGAAPATLHGEGSTAVVATL